MPGVRPLPEERLDSIRKEFERLSLMCKWEGNGDRSNQKIARAEPCGKTDAVCGTGNADDPVPSKRRSRRGFRPLGRALAFRYLMEKKSICIEEGELIVGERGESPKATPTFPELCTHTLQDLETIHSRQKVSFDVGPDARRVYERDIIPFWKGKTMRDRIFAQMSGPWKEAYAAGVFTEFMEQRAPGHTVLDGKIYGKGMNDFKKDIRRSLAGLDFSKDPEAYRKREELKAMAICADALIAFSRRHARRARELAGRESEGSRKRELLEIARIC